MNMKYLSNIAFGTWSWGTGAVGGDEIFGNHLDLEVLKPVFDAGMEAGINIWDTAPVYGMGASEAIIGQLMKQYPREELVLSTKFTPGMARTSDDPVGDLLKSSLDRLGTEYIDLYWIHNDADIEKWTPGLIPLLKAGLVKKVGVSNHNLEQIKRANAILAKEGFGITAVQNHYSLLYRSSENAGILDYCKEHDIIFFSYMVLEQGALTGKYDTRNPLPEGSGRAATYNKVLPQLEELIKLLAEIGKKRNASVAQVAIAWAIAKNTLPIVGVTKTYQVKDALIAASIELTKSEMIKIEQFADTVGVDTRGAWEKPMI